MIIAKFFFFILSKSSLNRFKWFLYHTRIKDSYLIENYKFPNKKTFLEKKEQNKFYIPDEIILHIVVEIAPKKNCVYVCCMCCPLLQGCLNWFGIMFNNHFVEHIFNLMFACHLAQFKTKEVSVFRVCRPKTIHKEDSHEPIETGIFVTLFCTRNSHTK